MMLKIRSNFSRFRGLCTIVTPIILMLNWYTCDVLAASSARRPHIVFILADDVGWNDLSFHGSNEIITPNIDALASNAIITKNLYTQPLCTPSRASFMTGKYPIHLGLQGYPILAAEPTGLPLNEKTIANYLSNLGYTTHAIGKWNLGSYKREFTPRFRGFDSFYGYYSGWTSYYDHMTEESYTEGTFCGYDWRRNEKPAWQEALGHYATDLFTKEAVDIIREHDTSKSPLFIYLAHLAGHAGNDASLLEAPQAEIDKFRHIMEPNRRIYAAIMSKMDQSVGDVVEALYKKGILNDTIIVFMSDNGAPTPSNNGTSSGLRFPNWGSNFPFRGTKGSLWQGGVRSPSLIWSAALQSISRVSNHLMHMSDWLPTLYEAAGGNPADLPSDLDGKSQWPIISANSSAISRRELLVNINEREHNWAVVVGNWKLILGSWNGQDGHYGTYWDLNDADREASYSRKVVRSKSYRVLRRLAASMCLPLANETVIRIKRQLATIKCDKNLTVPNNPIGPYAPVKLPSCLNKPCLFNLETDPCETENLAEQNPQIVAQLYQLFLRYNSSLVPQINQPPEPFAANPRLWNVAWSSWAS